MIKNQPTPPPAAGTEGSSLSGGLPPSWSWLPSLDDGQAAGTDHSMSTTPRSRSNPTNLGDSSEGLHNNVRLSEWRMEEGSDEGNDEPWRSSESPFEGALGKGVRRAHQTTSQTSSRCMLDASALRSEATASGITAVIRSLPSLDFLLVSVRHARVPAGHYCAPHQL